MDKTDKEVLTQYINKAAIIEEIERLEKENKKSEYVYNSLDTEYTLKSIMSFINTLEVKEVGEVDLEKALSDLDKDIKEFITTGEFERESKASGHYWAIAKHAFLLGLKAQKGE